MTYLARSLTVGLYRVGDSGGGGGWTEPPGVPSTPGFHPL